MRYAIICIATLAILWGFLAFSCSQLSAPQPKVVGKLPLIWNYANATVNQDPQYWGKTTSRPTGELYNAPADLPPAQLKDERLCVVTSLPGAQTYSPALHDKYRKPCAECHCAEEGAPWSYPGRQQHWCIANDGALSWWEWVITFGREYLVNHHINPNGIPNEYRGWYPGQYP